MASLLAEAVVESFRKAVKLFERILLAALIMYLIAYLIVAANYLVAWSRYVHALHAYVLIKTGGS